MELAILTVVATFFTGGIYLLLDRTLLRVIIGIGLMSNGTNLMLLASGGLRPGGAPIIAHGSQLTVDPLPQALILTAIVIGFGVNALLLTLALRIYQTHSTDDLRELHGRLADE